MKGGIGAKKNKSKLDVLKKELAAAMPLLTEEPPDHALALAEHDPWSGLTMRQKQIQSLKLRGISQRVIATTLSISQTIVHQELQQIRLAHKRMGSTVDTETYVGETCSIYEELAAQGWKGFMSIPEDHQSAPQLRLEFLKFIASTTRDKTKLLMDLGFVQKAPVELSLSLNEDQDKDEFQEKIKALPPEKKKQLESFILEMGMTQLDEPEPEEAEIM